MATRPLASLTDINTHLASGFDIPDDETADPLQKDAYTVIMSKLSGVFPQSILDTWVDADSTPNTINVIAARLIAAKWYMRQVNADSDNKIPPYSIQLFNEAMSMLGDVVTGAITVVDSNGDPIPLVTSSDDMTLNDFWPNASTAGPYFTMDAPYAK